MAGERARGLKLLEQEEYYEALVWLMLAADAEDEEAIEALEGLLTAELVAPEDETLAEFQVGCWYLRGMHVKADADNARAHLRLAAGAVGEVFDAKRFARDPEAVVEELRKQIGLPDTIDLRQPLGPAMPDTPGNVHPRHLK